MIEKIENGLKTLIKLVCVVVIIGGVNNIVNQINTASKARARNETAKKEVGVYRQKNIELLENIRYATSSAFINQALRSYFGVGGKNDYWLILPDMDLSRSDSDSVEIKDKSNVIKWLDLFTKGV